MRKLIYAINLSIDGICDHTAMTPPDEEGYDEYWSAFMREGGTLLYGRITYQLMVPYWPEIAKGLGDDSRAEIEFARAFDAVPSIAVFSRTLKTAPNPKTTIVNGDLKEEITKLKQQEGKPILAGGIDLASQLMELDLIDEYRFVVHPILVGKGRRLLEGVDLRERLGLKLISTRAFKTGCIALHYARR